MGEVAKQEQPKAEEKKEEKVEEKREEKVEDKKEDKAEEKKEEEPKPPSPCILYVDLHCVGCAKKIERSIMKIRGVEGVVIDMTTNQLTIKGMVDPQAVCNRIMKKTRRRAKVLSPPPPAEGEPSPEMVPSQVSGLITVELNVNMHCEACAEQLKRKILKMRGVQTAVTELSTGKVTVTGTMDANKLVDYVYRRTKKQAKIVPQPAPEPEPAPEKQDEKKEADDKPPQEEPKPEEKKEENNAKGEEKPQQEAKKEEGGENKDANGEIKEEETKIINYINEGEGGAIVNFQDDEGIKRMMHYYYQPLYVIERLPPPQLFSDENPNACCIS